MDEINIRQLKALRLSVGLVVLILWASVFTLFNPMTNTSGSMFDPDSLKYDIDYVNMLVCGAFGVVMGLFLLSIAFSTKVRGFALEPSREQHYAPGIFRFLGLLLMVAGIGWLALSFFQPF